MKIDHPVQDVVISGNFETSNYAVGDIAFIVDMFADKVYTHKERAVIRELSCNAYDSHVEAGNEDVDFDVHLPTALESWFSVRDYGTGLDDSQIREVFAGIGISTKRDSNKSIGCLGIGSLSPYALCDSFTVKSWKHGKLRTYSCYRGEDRKPVVALLVEVDTKEPNGVEVCLNVNGRVSLFEHEAKNVFKWWDRVPNINCQEVKRFCEEFKGLFYIKGDGYTLCSSGTRYSSISNSTLMESWEIIAVMGNVAYKIPQELDELNDGRRGRVQGFLTFELGELNFDTGRENLSLDDKTRLAIKERMEYVRGDISKQVTLEIEAETSPFKRALMLNRIEKNSIYNIIPIKNWEAMVSKFSLPEATSAIKYWKMEGRTPTAYYMKKLLLFGGNFDHSVEYYIDKRAMTGRIKNYLKTHSNRHLKVVLLTDNQVDEVLLDRDLLSDLNDLPKLDSCSRGPSVTSKFKTFTFRTKASHWGEAKDRWKEAVLPSYSKQEMVYVEIDRWLPVGGSDSLNSISDLLLRVAACERIAVPTVLGLKRAFCRTAEFKAGNFITLSDYISREAKAAGPCKYYSFVYSDLTKMKKVISVLESEELEEISDIIKTCKNNNSADAFVACGGKIEKDNTLQDCLDSFFEKYEMIRIISEWDINAYKDKVSRYINASVRK